ncbi:serine hydrolase domain-containing protein [Larkinella knui]|uniref:serine hydrolase domain-containing protein n=1 Tax=Larkinella knui TaxID=2025310 RepID=UPI00163A862F|nr:serine hydrolase domain-containing protein [Larkinella knui]
MQAQSRQPVGKALPAMLDSAGIPGLSIALIENGTVTWSTGLGIKNTITQEPVAATTIFRAASLGKPLFAYAVLKLCEERTIALDSALVRYVPQTYLEDYFLKSPLADERIRLITARMVLNHTSGLPNWRAEGKPLTTLFAPGTRYSYSGEGFYLLQTVVEYLVKEPIEAFMQRTVLKPLGMKNTSYVYHPADSSRYTRSYDQTGNWVPDEPEPANVAHTLRTTADDYARFLVATLLKPGPTPKLMLGSQVQTDICQPGRVFWGLGIAIQHTGQGDLFCQWAKSPAASGYVIGSADQKTALVYFVNVANRGLQIAERLVKLSLNYDDPLFACFGVRPYNAGP